MALTAILCSTDQRTVEDKKQDFKYLRMSKTSDPVASDSKDGKKVKANPFRSKPRGPRSESVQINIIEHPKRKGSLRKRFSGEGAGKKCSSNNPQQSIGTLANGLKENGTKFLKNHTPFKRPLLGKKSVNKQEKSKQQQHHSNQHQPPQVVDASTVETTKSLPLLPVGNKCDAAPSTGGNTQRGLHYRVSCDSGNGDDLSSSCDSSVVLDNGVQKCSSNLHMHQVHESETEEEGSPEEEVFVDALSNISSDDEDYVTPLTSRTPSTTCLTIDEPSSTAPSTTPSTNSLITTAQGKLEESLTTQLAAATTNDHTVLYNTEKDQSTDGFIDSDLNATLTEKNAVSDELDIIDSDCSAAPCNDVCHDETETGPDEDTFIDEESRPIMVEDNSHHNSQQNGLQLDEEKTLLNDTETQSGFNGEDEEQPAVDHGITFTTDQGMPDGLLERELVDNERTLSQSPVSSTGSPTHSASSLCLASNSSSPSLDGEKDMNDFSNAVCNISSSSLATRTSRISSDSELLVSSYSRPTSCLSGGGTAVATSISPVVVSTDAFSTAVPHSSTISAAPLTTPVLHSSTTTSTPSCTTSTPSCTDTIQVPSTVHPLYYNWVLWYDKLTTGRPQFSEYEAHLQKVSAIRSVEEFWSVMNNLRPPSQLAKNSNYHFFKEGIRPLWEDSANEHGGKWVITFKNVNNSGLLDNVWLEVLMSLIGEHIEKSHLINGVVLSRRKKSDRIALWTSNKKKSSNLLICKQLLSVLANACDIKEGSYSKFVSDLAEDVYGFNMVYMLHRDSLRTGTSYQNESHLTLKQHLNFMLGNVR